MVHYRNHRDLQNKRASVTAGGDLALHLLVWLAMCLFKTTVIEPQ